MKREANRTPNCMILDSYQCHFFYTAVFGSDYGGLQLKNWTELTCNKLTQLHDALLVTRVTVTKLIGCSSRTAVSRTTVRKLEFSLVQFVRCERPFTRNPVLATAAWMSYFPLQSFNGERTGAALRSAI